MPGNNIKVSVCIPVYGVEKYIERCARSLFEQTMTEGIEFIFVNDCTKDKSIEILEKVLGEYPHRKEQVKIIHHKSNLGAATARITAIASCTGDYVIHCDSDDWVEADLYEKMYNRAVETNADMVYCDYIIDGVNKSKKVKFRTITSKEKFFFYMCANQCYVSSCNKLYTRNIARLNLTSAYTHIGMNEDFAYNILCFKEVNIISHLKGSYYHYFSNFESTSKKKWKRSHFESILDVYKMISNYVDNGFYAPKCKKAYEQVILFLLLRHPEITKKEEFLKYKKRFITSLLQWTPMSLGRKIGLVLGMINDKIPLLLLKIKQR